MTEVADEPSRELSPFDYVEYCLELHSQSRTSYMSIEILDSAPSWETLSEDFDRATRLVPRLRQRVVTPVLPVASAQWVVDPDFNLGFHLRRMSLPSPGAMRDLLDLAQTLHATPLDLDRPLWEATLVEGLEDGPGRAAIILKLGTPVYDGLSGLELDRLIHSDEPKPDRGPMPPLPVPEDVSSVDLTRREVRRLPRTLTRRVVRNLGGAVRTVKTVAADPKATAHDLSQLAGVVGRLGASPDSDPSPLLRRRSLRRRLDSLAVDLRPLQAVAQANECSVHDACVAAVCGGLRMYHEHLGVPVDTLPLAMPLDVRFEDTPAGGDLWTGFRTAAPVGVVDPTERMRILREAVLRSDPEPAFRLLRSAAPVLSWLPTPMLGALGQIGRGVDVHVGSVRGQPGQVYMSGSRLTRIVPVGPVLGGAMTVLFALAGGTCHVGVNLDPLAVADPDEFMRCLQRGFDEVAATDPATHARVKRSSKGSPKSGTAKQSGSTS